MVIFHKIVWDHKFYTGELDLIKVRFDIQERGRDKMQIS